MTTEKRTNVGSDNLSDEDRAAQIKDLRDWVDSLPDEAMFVDFERNCYDERGERIEILKRAEK